MAHRDPASLHPIYDTTRPGDSRIGHAKWLRLHDEAFARSKEEFAKHFKEKYSGEFRRCGLPPNCGTLGTCRFYAGMKKRIRTKLLEFSMSHLSRFCPHDLTGLFWTKLCEKLSLERNFSYAEEEVQRGADRGAAPSD
jgi:hypothetical protein